VSGSAGPPPSMWSSRRFDSPRVLLAADASPDGAALQPLFVGAVRPTKSAPWDGVLWTMPRLAEVPAGTVMFTVDGALAGAVTVDHGQRAIVPADLLVAAAERLARDGAPPRAAVGVDVQPLTADLAAATGSTAGVVVTWVDPNGPAAEQVAVADVIERVNGRAIASPDDWAAATTALNEGQSMDLAIRHASEAREVVLIAATAAPAERPLGLTARFVPGVGSQIVRVGHDSAAHRAGLRAGDLITVIGDVHAPTPVQLSRAFASAADRPIAVGVTRGDAHLVTALDRRP